MKFKFSLKENYQTKIVKLLAIILLISVSTCTLNSSTTKIKTENQGKLKEKIDFLHYMAQKNQNEKVETITRLRKRTKNTNDFKFKSTTGKPRDTRATWKFPVPDGALLESWMTISSDEFQNIKRFPPITLPNGTLDTINTNPLNFRLNSAFNCTDAAAKPADERLFWFRLTNASVYYSSSPSDMNVLGYLGITDVYDIDENIDISGEKLYHCIKFKDEIYKEWKICNEKETVIRQWFCTIKKYLKQSLDEESERCWGIPNDEDLIITEKKIKKPIIMVPLPSPTCNEKWDYKQNGEDWECDCKEGVEQSPIDLPSKEKALQSPVKPMFQYLEVDYINNESTLEGFLEARKKLEIRNSDNMINVWHNDFGKVTTIDGTSYQAQQITFHTPSNHNINGKQYPLEVTITHFGITKGDIGKQLTLSFLFEPTPGVYNKFLDDLDVFNLPDPIQKKRGLQKPLFIPNILYEDNPEEVVIPIMKPFSFYTYEGSLPFPPCTERTITLVASKPLRVSSTAITLLKEAIKMPDLKTKTGEIIPGDDSVSSNRSIKPLNNRPVFHYNADDNCGQNVPKPKPPKSGHYEKVLNRGTQYFFVSGNEPSGLPGAFVVSEKEAKGLGFQEV